MKRLLATLLVLLAVSALPGCGNVFIRGAINPGFVRGTVSVLQLSTAFDNGVFLTVTLVTFEQSSTATTLTFCGDQSSMFLVNNFFQVSFTPGTPCDSILQITR
ncbi:MAG TPA: hypothetical protein VFI95_15000 [Terriglobales bacterium]|nr:hypothetical protein [Terriglobales bacterium]